MSNTQKSALDNVKNTRRLQPTKISGYFGSRHCCLMALTADLINIILQTCKQEYRPHELYIYIYIYTCVCFMCGWVC